MRRQFAIAAALVATLVCAAPAPAAAACPTSGLGSGSLPDCRVYEQVSPLDKNAYEAGLLRSDENPGIAYASPDGSRVYYATGGAMGQTETGLQNYTLSSRGESNWHARNAFPRPGDPEGVGYGQIPRSILPADDLSSFFFWAPTRWLPQVPQTPGYPNDGSGTAAYLLRDGQPLQWVSEPRVEDAFKRAEGVFRIRPAGASPDLDRVYFSYLGTLLPGDEPRRPYAEENRALGLYEYEEGELRNAGALPDGTLDPMGAVAAGSIALAPLSGYDNTLPENFNNQVSDDGRTLWFVSPDPTPDRERVTQLYVRVNGASALASRSELTGQPAATGVRPAAHRTSELPTTDTYAFGAEDGSRAFFLSADRLTADAPDDAMQKAYMYEVASGDLVYLPELNDAYILEGSQDGSRLLLLNADRTQLEFWEEGSGLTLLGEVASFSFGGTYSPTARATTDGSVFAFTLEGELTGFSNPSGQPQAYRYEVASGALDCISCPAGGPPSSGAVLSRAASAFDGQGDGTLDGMRAMSVDGNTVFFDTAEALVPADSNGQRDAYRWSKEDGPRLISTGHSGTGSFMLDISADGSSAFFTTREGISPLDTDDSADVYVARIGGGFPSTALPPCAGEECQGPMVGPPAQLEPGTKSFHGRGSGRVGPRLAARLTGQAGKLRLRVSAPAGRVVVSGPRVQPLKRQIAKAGSYVLRPKLKPAARKALNRGGQLEVRLKVRFLPRDGRATVRTLTTEVSR